jgi:hypothetical protein
MMTTSNMVKQAAIMARDLDPGSTFGERQVYISAVWEQTGGRLSLEAFKAELVELARRGEVELVRADLVNVMDPALVEASEVCRGAARYHFVVIA